jgi:hypothetical protein
VRAKRVNCFPSVHIQGEQDERISSCSSLYKPPGVMDFIRVIKSSLVALSARLFSVDNGTGPGYIRVSLAVSPPRKRFSQIAETDGGLCFKDPSEGAFLL